MNKWADYCTTAVRYDKQKDYIAEVETFYFNGETLAAREVLEVDIVVRLIDRNVSFVTAVYGHDGLPRPGQGIEVYDRNGVRFIRSVGNQVSVDYLENLPRF